MARSFAGSDGLRLATTFLPSTISFWFYPTDAAGTTQTLYSQQNAANTSYHKVMLNGATTTISIASAGGGAGAVPSVATVAMNAWNHCAAVLASTGTLLALNGGAWQTGGSGCGTVASIRLGMSQLTSVPVTFGNYFTGRIAELAIWNVDLNAINANVHLAWAAKFCPLFQQTDPAFGVSGPGRYWPFWTTDVDREAGTPAWTTTGSPSYGDHCPQIYNVSGMGGQRAA